MSNIDDKLCQIQGELGLFKRDSVNPHFGNRFTSLAGKISQALPLLQKHGLYFRDVFHEADPGISAIETLLIDKETGEKISSGVNRWPAAKDDPQGYKSTTSYQRRANRDAILGSADEDDDAERARIAIERVQPLTLDQERDLLDYISRLADHDELIKNYTDAMNLMAEGKITQGRITHVKKNVDKCLASIAPHTMKEDDELEPQGEEMAHN